MTRDPRLPRLARWLLRLTRVHRDHRADVEDDLLELFTARRRSRGVLSAHWRLYRDMASLAYVRAPLTDQQETRPRVALLADAGGDLRYAARLFARQPAILLLTILGLSLGLAVATAAFSILNAAVLRGEGLDDSGRVPLVLKVTERSVTTAWNYDEFLQLRGGATRMQVEAVLTDNTSVRTESGEGPGPMTSTGFVSGGFFAATGGGVVLGRPLGPSDDHHLDSPPVVVSFMFWTSRLNRDPNAIGRTIRIGRATATIVGVAERGFSVPNLRMVWIPLTAHANVYSTDATARTPPVQVFGRLPPEASIAEAEAQLSGVAAALPVDAMSMASGDSRVRVRLDSDSGLGRTSSATMFAVALFVIGTIGLVLLLACTNVASVLIATAITRERELGVRAALGASRWRIVRQLLTESLALGSIASAIGLLFATWALPTIGRMIEAPPAADIAPDLTVLAFLAIVTVATGVGAGLAPAWHGRGADLVTPLKGDGGGGRRVAPRRLRSALIAMQAAVSIVLIVMATLFVRASLRAAAIDVGFDPQGLYAMSVGLGNKDGGAAIRQFWARALSELQAVPGVTGVALSELTPFGNATKTSLVGDGPNRAVVHLNRTRAEYFETMGLRLRAGRIYTRDEVAGNAPVVVISESLARAFWRGESALGQVLPDQIKRPPGSSVRPVIVGVVADAIPARLNELSALALYEPLDRASEIFAQLLIRVSPGTSGVIDDVTRRLRAIDRDADVRVQSVAAQLEQEMNRPRMVAALTVAIGVIAILLCVIGLYGLTASVVGQRTREMGVRVAMGAAPGDLLRLMMWDSLRPVAIGLAIGTAAALLASRVAVSSILFGVPPNDPVAFGGAAAILLTSATVAVLLPTRRAAAVDAAGALRGA